MRITLQDTPALKLHPDDDVGVALVPLSVGRFVQVGDVMVRLLADINPGHKFALRSVEQGQPLRRYWTTACGSCVLKTACTTGKERRITRAEDEHILEAVQRRLDADPTAMRRRRETVEHPFGTIKARMGATHFLTRTMPKVATEMALAVLAYNFTRVLNILGVKPMIAAMRA